jgi:hypothetical protein
MKTLFLILAFAGGAWANTITFTTSTNAWGYTGPGHPCTGITSCTSQAWDAFASATAGYDAMMSFQGFPSASVSLFADCRVDNTCTEAQGMASFSVDFTILGAPAGTPGVLEMDVSENGSPIWGRATASVGLTRVGFGPHFGTDYQFTFGQPFTVSGSIEGGCSQCGNAPGEANTGFVRVTGVLYVYDTQGELLDTIRQGPGPSGQIVATVPEPGSMLLSAAGLVGLGVFVLRRRALRRVSKTAVCHSPLLRELKNSRSGE